jgi:hypothetical protein
METASWILAISAGLAAIALLAIERRLWQIVFELRNRAKTDDQMGR